MNIEKKTAVAAAVIVGAFALSMVAAVVLFKMLESSADVTWHDSKLGGAFAGFVVTFFLVTNGAVAWYNMYSADETKELRREIQELQLKLFKGAPCPEGFVRKIDEINRIIFAHPAAWRPPPVQKLYEYKGEGATNFNLNIQEEVVVAQAYGDHNMQFDPKNIDLDELYDVFGSSAANPAVWAAVLPKNIKYGNAHIDAEAWRYWDLKARRITHYFELQEIGADGKTETVKMRQRAVNVWLPDRKAMMSVTFTDFAENFVKSSEIFDKILASIVIMPLNPP